MGKTEDRRVRRTKKLLRESIAELMTEKEFKDITVKDITDRADLNRGTFYLHYKDTYDLLEKIEEELIHTFESLIENYHPTEGNLSAFMIINQMYDYISENIKICKLLFLNYCSENYEKKLLNIIATKGFEINSRFGTGNNEKKAEYKAFFFAYGLLGLVKRWLEDNMSIPKEDMVKMTDQLISSAFQIKITVE